MGYLAESLLTGVLLIWATTEAWVSRETDGGHTTLIKQECASYVWVLFLSFLAFELMIQRFSQREAKSRLGMLWNERQDAGNGIVIGSCLLPLSLLVHLVLFDPVHDPTTLLSYFDSIICSTLVILLFWISGCFAILRNIPGPIRYLLSLLLLSFSFSQWTMQHGVKVEWYLISGIISGCVFFLLSASFQESFTIGEQMCIAQALSVTGLNAGSITLNAYLGHRPVPFTPHHIVTQGVVQGIFFCCLITFPFLQYIRKRQLSNLRALEATDASQVEIRQRMAWDNFYSLSCFLFYTTNFIIIGLVDLSIQEIAGFEPWSWVLGYAVSDPSLVCICVVWLLLIGVAVAFLGEENRPKVPRIIIRKFYHIITLVMFIPVIYARQEFIYVAFGAAFAGMVFAEGLRFGLIPPVGHVMDRFLRSFTDNRDRGIVILSHIYLLLGCACTVWINRIHQIDNMVPSLSAIAPFAGVLILGGADSAASYVGINYGRHKWPGTSKTIEGSVGALLCLLGMVYALLWLYGLQYFTFWVGLRVTMACALSCLLEAFTDQNDNLVLPIYFEMALTLCSF